MPGTEGGKIIFVTSFLAGYREQGKINEIENRLKDYLEHKNDPYVYYPEEIPAVRVLLSNAPKDIEFLLNFIKTLKK